MIGFRPARPVGSSAEALFHQAVWDELFGGGRRLAEVPGMKVSRTTRGDFSVPEAVSSTPAAATGPQRYRVKSVFGAYLGCVTWNGTAEGTSTAWVAKNPWLRWYLAAWPGVTIVGDAVTFTWMALAGNLDGQRVTADSAGSPAQSEIVVPVYQAAAAGAGVAGAYDEIWADTPTGGTGVVGDGVSGGCPTGQVITLLDDNRAGRTWEQLLPSYLVPLV